MNIALCGRGWFGAETLALVRARGHHVALVTAPTETSDRLANAARRAGVPVLDPSRFHSTLVPDDTDLIVAAHAHHFIARQARNRARFGAIGYHPSLLPLHRGRDAVRWTVHMRDRVAGGSVYWLTDTVDGGPIAAQDFCLVRPTDTARSLWERDLGPLGLRLFGRVLDDIARGVLVRIEQDERLATWEPSFGVAPIHRPEVPRLGDGSPSDVVVITDRADVPVPA